AVLGKEKVGANDSFFDLGGHSLLAVRLMTEVDRVFGRKLPVQILFESATVRSIAEELSREMGSHCWSLVKTITPVSPGTTRPPFFCVAAPFINSLGY